MEWPTAEWGGWAFENWIFDAFEIRNFLWICSSKTSSFRSGFYRKLLEWRFKLLPFCWDLMHFNAHLNVWIWFAGGFNPKRIQMIRKSQQLFKPQHLRCLRTFKDGKGSNKFPDFFVRWERFYPAPFRPVFEISENPPVLWWVSFRLFYIQWRQRIERAFEYHLHAWNRQF